MIFSKKYKDLENTSFVHNTNIDYLEEILKNIEQVPANDKLKKELKNLFKQDSVNTDYSHHDIENLFIQIAKTKPNIQSSQIASSNQQINAEYVYKLHKVLKLIDGYRNRGHQRANLDPLGRNITNRQVREIELEELGLSKDDLGLEFSIPNFNNNNPIKLKNLISKLEKIYCHSVGYEYSYIPHTTKKQWLQDKIENDKKIINEATKNKILNRLVASEGLEKHLHNKYLGQKRFSLEGGDSLIVALESIILESAQSKVNELLIGMAHRGRLNVLVNTFGKNPADLFQEFEGNKYSLVEEGFSGDVKYHMGFSSDLKIIDHDLHLVLAFNPSHLEIVSPVVQGSARARQEKLNDTNGEKVLPVVIHGDSSFAGQGVVMETFSMVETRGYSTKGTIHIVINNQIGFTTSSVQDVRSTIYCTDVAKMINAPIIHVNGDDAEEVYRVAKLAVEYRQRFNHDIVIDIVCYRRHGHNESDEPSVTQPMMYQKIKQKLPVSKIYANQLIAEGYLSNDSTDELLKNYRKRLEAGKAVAPYIAKLNPKKNRVVEWGKYTAKNWSEISDTRYEITQLKNLATKLNTIPENITLHPRVTKIIGDRLKMAQGEKLCDWGFAENLSYATLLNDGYKVRLSGQDSGRGTFFHRHAVIHNQDDGSSYVPLRNIENVPQNNFLVIDSLLSEEAVLAFEYGYSATNPDSLAIWEAQFGDFANGAQVVIDQFISSGEVKWERLSNLIMLLPHGYEGQGPEHSSARLERYMQLCAEKNMFVIVPTTPAQIYHLLRLQMKRLLRKPVIVMTPKSLLRNPHAVSPLEQLANGCFQRIIDDEFTNTSAKNVTRIILTYGKIYYDLLEYRNQHKINDVALVRIEQLYPVKYDEMAIILDKYKNSKSITWCQEEPRNQGAWRAIRHRIEFCRDTMCTNLKQIPLKCVSRPSSASPAVGYAKVSTIQQQRIIQDAFSI